MDCFFTFTWRGLNQLILNHDPKNKVAVLLPDESIPISLNSVLWQLKQFYDNDDDNKLQGYKYEWNLWPQSFVVCPLLLS